MPVTEKEKLTYFFSEKNNVKYYLVAFKKNIFLLYKISHYSPRYLFKSNEEISSNKNLHKKVILFVISPHWKHRVVPSRVND